jgi:hypothetical protein
LAGEEIYFSLRHCVQTGSGAHPASYQMDTGGSFQEVNRPGREADHSLPSSAEVRNVWSYTSTPSVCLHDVVLSYGIRIHGVVLLKQRDNFTFTVSK